MRQSTIPVMLLAALTGLLIADWVLVPDGQPDPVVAMIADDTVPMPIVTKIVSPEPVRPLSKASDDPAISLPISEEDRKIGTIWATSWPVSWIKDRNLGAARDWLLEQSRDLVDRYAELELEAVESEAIVGRQMRLVAYTAEWCKYCPAMLVVWQQLSDDGFDVIIVDVDKPSPLLDGFTPDRIPLTVLFADKEFQRQWVGKVSLEELRLLMRGDYGNPPVSLGQVLLSPRSALLCAAAMESAELQATKNKQGHFEWNRRRQEILESSGYPSIEEICAESWEDQRDDTDEELWREAFYCWEKSSREKLLGHWRIANNRWYAYGLAKSQGSNGVWYFTILVAGGNPN